MSVRPLEGVRIVDFTWVRAGPWATRWLSLLGADVIKVEWPDPAIGTSTGRAVTNAEGTPAGAPQSMNSSGGFNDGQIMKRSITVNTRSAQGLDAIKRLIAISDVVIENFSAGVLKSWGLSFAEMQALKPDIIYVSMAGFGHSGPRTNYTTMGPSVQALSGLTFLSGLPDKPPAGWGWSYMDDTGGMYGAMSVLSALQHRHTTGDGQHVDMAQVSAGMTLTGAALLDLEVNGRGSRRPGYPPGNRTVWPGTPPLNNYRGPICAPHNAYRTQPSGYNDWIAIACETDEEWQRLATVMGSPEWAIDPRFATLAGRLEHQEEMDTQIEAWTQTVDKYALTDRCQAGGVRALPVQSSEDRVEHDPQLRARGHYAKAPHPILGMWPIQQAPWKMSRTPTPVERGAPLAGEHNIEILCDLLGVTLDELRAGYADNTYWPASVPIEPYLLEMLDQAAARPTGTSTAAIPKAPPRPITTTSTGGAPHGPLAGVRVIELAGRSGQWCGKLMADFGADVIKVEPPGGVPERHVGPFYKDIENPNRSLYFWHYNTSKRSVTLDIGTERGRELFRTLVATADVLIETMPPGALDAMGLGYEVLAKEHPGLIVSSLTPFGQDGPWRDYLDSDLLQLAAGGQMAGCGYDAVDDPDQHPIAPGGGNGWHIGGHYAYIATLAALQHKNATGEGQHVDVSIHEACALTTEGAITTWIYQGGVVKRQTGRHSSVRPTPPNQLPTADGKFLQLTTNAMQPARLKPMIAWMDRLGFAGDLNDPKYLDPARFDEHRAHVAGLVAIFLLSMSAEEAMTGGQETAGAGWGTIRAPEEVFEDEHFRERGFFVEVEHPELGETFTYPGAAAIYPASPWRIYRRAPLIGEDNAAVYAEIGVDAPALAQLRERGIA